jgi:hypothetical protein
MIQRPSVGRVVLVTVHPTTNNGAPEAPAIITRVWSDLLINVHVFLDGGRSMPLTSIPLHPDLDSLNTAAVTREPEQQAYQYTAAYWPPRI